MQTKKHKNAHLKYKTDESPLALLNLGHAPIPVAAAVSFSVGVVLLDCEFGGA